MNCAWPPSRWGDTTIRLGNGHSRLGPERRPDQVEAAVDPGGRTSARQDRAVVHVEHVGDQLHIRVSGAHQVGVLPVRGRPPSTQGPASARTKAPLHKLITVAPRSTPSCRARASCGLTR